MSDRDFLELRNALDLLRSRFNVQAVVVSGSTQEINEKIASSYNEDQLPKGKTMLCGVEIVGLSK